MSKLAGAAASAILVILSAFAVLAETADVAALKARKAALEQELAEVNAALTAAGEPVAAAAGQPEALIAYTTDETGLIYAGVIEIGAGMTFAACAGCGDKLDDRRYPELAGAARANIPLADAIALQLDLGGWSAFTDRGEYPKDPGEDNLTTLFEGAAHLAWRDPTTGAAGVFGQLGSVSAGENVNANYYALGVEGQYYLDAVTLYGQAGGFIADDEAERDVLTDAYFARGVVRWYPSDRLRLQAEAAYFEGEEKSDAFSLDDADFSGGAWGLRADYRLPNRPFNLFAAYDGVFVAADRDEDFSIGNQDYKDHRVMIGASIPFGGGSQKAHDRQGVAFDTAPVGRWIGPSLEIIDD